MSSETEYVINDFLSLRLEDGETILYVAGERFRQCKYLFLNLPDQTTGDQINSIDEAAQHYNADLEGEYTGRGVHPEDYGLTDEEVFFGHCSNLQAWAEHDYNTRLLHSNLAFPLLQRLMEAGDPKAKGMFKEEVAKRFMEGNAVVQEFLIEEGFMEQFTEEEFYGLFLTETHHDAVKEISEQLGKDIRSYLYFSNVLKRQVIKLNISFGSKLPRGLLRLKDSLKILEITSVDITEIPDWIGELESLEELRIEYCPIKELPESIGNLSSLKELIINNTKITFLPFSTGDLSNLETLYLYNNRLDELPEQFENLTNLRHLGLTNNRFKNFPTTLLKLVSLKGISIEKNQLEKLPNWIIDMPNLKNLIIDEELLEKHKELTEKCKKYDILIRSRV